MKNTLLNSIVTRLPVFLAIAFIATACKIVVDDGSTVKNDGNGSGADTASCSGASEGVKWEALLSENCPNLADYNLFADPADPTSGPNSGGLPYDLTTALFTDYASKYRYVFIPEGEQASYSQTEAFDFPVGTVIVKTFAMPENTAFRDGAERIIETRLLIHRADGWVGRPYVWFDTEGNQTDDARLAITGGKLDLTTTHEGAAMDVEYAVPSVTQCTACHNIVPLVDPGPERPPIAKVIGPKARYLNKDYDYGDVIENQITHWANAGKLNGVPSDFNAIEKAPEFSDLTDVSAMSDADVMETAKAYLDINCAHCHRANLGLPQSYGGAAGGSGLRVEWQRSLEDDAFAHGVCKEPVAGGLAPYEFDVVPGAPELSYLVHRMSTDDERQRMPELGRSLVHAEGVQLIERWVANLPAANCSP